LLILIWFDDSHSVLPLFFTSQQRCARLICIFPFPQHGDCGGTSQSFDFFPLIRSCPSSPISAFAISCSLANDYSSRWMVTPHFSLFAYVLPSLGDPALHAKHESSSPVRVSFLPLLSFFRRPHGERKERVFLFVLCFSHISSVYALPSDRKNLPWPPPSTCLCSLFMFFFPTRPAFSTCSRANAPARTHLLDLPFQYILPLEVYI